MDMKRQLALVLFSTAFFTLLFNNQSLGLNILIFELFAFITLLATKQINLKNRNILWISVALLLTAFAVVFVNSILAILVNFLICFLFGGIVLYPNAKSLINSGVLSFLNFFNSQPTFIKSILYSTPKGKSLGVRLRKIRIFLIPLIIIIIFIGIYSNSNPVFENMVAKIMNSLDKFFNLFFKYIDFVLTVNILFGLAISNSIFFRKADKGIIKSDISSTDWLNRIRKKSVFSFRINGLSNELKAAVFLLFILNIIIFILNFIDIYWVWFNFSWNGALLKQFVHEGTYLLILSILISIIIVLYYFRSNLNFFSKNKWLKYLSYVWLFQNAILAISVGVRNFWYIYYYSLAYKRIGVIVFLLLTLYGLFSVYIKVKEKKSAFYLIRYNTLAFVIMMVVFSLFNWDTIIARYNFANRHRAYVHFEFLASLSDKALPYLEYPLEELQKTETRQDSIFPLTRGGQYITAFEYVNRIEIKKQKFKRNWESKGILSWNYPEYVAYTKIFVDKKEK